MRLTVMFVAVVAAGIAVAAAAQMSPMMGNMMGGGRTRHMLYMHNGLPPAYAGKHNPLADTPAVLAQGRALYAANCAACHGAKGHGDGPMAGSLNPPPADLSLTISMPVARDDFLYWTIAEGGQPTGSAMPAFKDTLKPGQIWAVVSALRSGELGGR